MNVQKRKYQFIQALQLLAVFRHSVRSVYLRQLRSNAGGELQPEAVLGKTEPKNKAVGQSKTQHSNKRAEKKGY